MTPTLCISIHDPRNLGDAVCNPADYFPIPRAQRHDAWQLAWAEDEGHNMVLGGGGLVHGVIAHALAFVPRRPERKLIAWGIGHNQHGAVSTHYGATLDGFDLVGCRDHRAAEVHGWHYVPCPSCMHPAFDTPRGDPTQRYVVYEHAARPLSLYHAPVPIPHWHNALHRDNFASVLDYLASAEVVITNTYHGAYWAMLLGRKVMLHEPFSSRFYGFQYQPPFVTSESWRFTLPLTPPATFLTDCRYINRSFATVVDAYLSPPATTQLTTLAPSANIPSLAPANT